MWIIVAAGILASMPLAAPVALGDGEESLVLPLSGDERMEIETILDDPARNLTLVLSSVAAAATAGASYDVYVAPGADSPCKKDETLVGVISTYDGGGDFIFAIENALGDKAPASIGVTFKPTHEFDNAQDTRLRIGEISIGVDE